jgi:hypothetical protein
MSEYSVEEVREAASATIGKVRGMLTACADLLEQIERARDGVTEEVAETIIEAVYGSYEKSGCDYSRTKEVRAALQAVAHLLLSGERAGVDGAAPVAFRWRDNVRPGLAWFLTDSADYAKQLRLTNDHDVESLFTHPPAQAAQVDAQVDEGMVDRAWRALAQFDPHSIDGVRAAIEAALAQPAQVAGVDGALNEQSGNSGQFDKGVLEGLSIAKSECDSRIYALDGGGNQFRREATASQCSAAIQGVYVRRYRAAYPDSPAAQPRAVADGLKELADEVAACWICASNGEGEITLETINNWSGRLAMLAAAPSPGESA